MLQKLILAGVLSTALIPQLAPAATMPVSRAEMKDQWPFTIDSGVLGCDRMAITFRANGISYAVNGTAKTQGQKLGWRDSRDIWKDDPANPGAKINIGPLLSRGQLLCK